MQSTVSGNPLRDSVVAAFSEDWFVDYTTSELRRQDCASSRQHLVWAMYCALKNWWLKDTELRKFRFPLQGDNMPSHPDVPRKYEWVSDALSIREADLSYLSGGPLFGKDGVVMVEPRAGGFRLDPRKPETNLSEDWELVPRGKGGVIRRKDKASSQQYTVEELYMFCSEQAAGPIFIAYDVPMGRDRPTGVPGLKRRYWIEPTWELSREDVAFLVDGPLICNKAVVVPESGGMAQRIYIDEIDSFRRVQEVTPEMGSQLLPKGVLPLPEAEVKRRIQDILGVIFQHKDWSGERSDLYTSLVKMGGRRVDAAFLLKGPGIKKDTMYIGDLGKRGDQVQRLFTEPALLFVIQSNGKIDSSVHKHVRSEAESVKREVYYCIIDGIDTARLLLAYGDPREEAPAA